jgi:hypothetical protein
LRHGDVHGGIPYGQKLADGLGAADGLAWDQFGRSFVSDWTGGRVFVIARPGAKPVLVTQGLTNAADLTVEAATKRLLIPDMYFLTTTVNGQGIYWFSN